MIIMHHIVAVGQANNISRISVSLSLKSYLFSSTMTICTSIMLIIYK